MLLEQIFDIWFMVKKMVLTHKIIYVNHILFDFNLKQIVSPKLQLLARKGLKHFFVFTLSYT